MVDEWWKGLETEFGWTGGEGWDTGDPGSLCSVEGQGEERQGVQDEGAGSAEGIEGNSRGLAAEATKRLSLQEELGWVARSDYKLVVGMAACTEKEGVGFYARQGWAGGGGVWEWDPFENACEPMQAANQEGARGS